MTQPSSTNFRSGYIAILGRPNVGKSTLLNALLQYKLSIVTPKPQTTRNRIQGIYTSDTAQMIFLDTPGMMDPKYKMQEYLLRTAESAAREADLLLVIIEPAAKVKTADRELFEKVQPFDKPMVVCINKIDQAQIEILLPQIRSLADIHNIMEIVPISALKRDGIDALLDVLEKCLPIGPLLYPIDQMTTEPERFFVAEIIREKIFLQYGDEIPYSTGVLIEEFKERRNGRDYIRAAVIVERESQKGILVGKAGTALKKVGVAARKEIEQFLGRKVYLELFVVVRPQWRQKDSTLRDLGLTG